MAFYHSPDFRALEQEWYQKLETDGFSDIEDRNGILKNPDIRTQSFRDQGRIRDFFLDLDTLITHYPEMPSFERKVLEMHSKGMFGTHIAKKLKTSRRTVVAVIKRYKDILKVVNRIIDADSDCALSTRMNAKSYGDHGVVDEDRTNSDKAA